MTQPLRTLRLGLLALSCIGLGACSNTSMKNTGIGAAIVTLADSGSLLGVETLAAGAVIYALYDPAAPNWSIEVEEIEQDEHYRLHLKHKALHTGGDGEARQVFQRNAQKVAKDNDMPAFEVISYEEGVESSRPFARRVAVGDIRILRSRSLPTGGIR
jgi:hypothetical protein